MRWPRGRPIVVLAIYAAGLLFVAPRGCWSRSVIATDGDHSEDIYAGRAARIDFRLKPGLSNGGGRKGGAAKADAVGNPQPRVGLGPRKIKYLSLIAERHSGSTWMVNFLAEYFRGKDVSVVPTLCNWKHWFQSRIHEGIQSGERSCRPTQKCPACHDTDHTLVIAMWRNPYDWTAAMSQRAHHAGWHDGLADQLDTFITKRWMVPAETEVGFREAAAKMNPNTEFCIDNFLPWEVVPCMKDNRNSIYELDEKGDAYGNVYELRKGKIVDFNEVREWVPMYEQIRYEDMLDVAMLRSWLMSLETKYGLVGHHNRIPTAEVGAAMRTKLSNMYYTNSNGCAPKCPMGVQRDALDTMNELFDEELEGTIGYHKIPVP